MKRALLWLALAVALLAGGVWWVNRDTSPVVNGVRLAAWLDAPEGSPLLEAVDRGEMVVTDPAVGEYLAREFPRAVKKSLRAQERAKMPWPEWRRTLLPASWTGADLDACQLRLSRINKMTSRLSDAETYFIPMLAETFRRGNAREREIVCYRLRRFGPASWPTLLSLLETSDPAGRVLLYRHLPRGMRKQWITAIPPDVREQTYARLKRIIARETDPEALRVLKGVLPHISTPEFPLELPR